MKQNITQKDWDETDRDIQLYFLSDFNIWSEQPLLEDIDIGFMIEYLGENLSEIVYLEKVNKFLVATNLLAVFRSNELCDALWMAIKHKLKK